MKTLFFISLFFLQVLFASYLASQPVSLESTNKKINVAWFNEQNGNFGEWNLRVYYNDNIKLYEAIPQIKLGLSLSDPDFSTFYKAVDENSTIDVRLLRRGGFAANLKPIEL